MLDIDVEDQLVDKVGGKLRLTSLVQKRMIELKRGAPPLVKKDRNATLLDIIVTEILEDKIDLAPRDECDMSLLEGARRVRRTEESTSDREIYGSELKRIKEQRIKELSALLNPTKK